jgi:hypothetical protein
VIRAEPARSKVFLDGDSIQVLSTLSTRRDTEIASLGKGFEVPDTARPISALATH